MVPALTARDEMIAMAPGTARTSRHDVESRSPGARRTGAQARRSAATTVATVAVDVSARAGPAVAAVPVPGRAATTAAATRRGGGTVRETRREPVAGPGQPTAGSVATMTGVQARTEQRGPTTAGPHATTGTAAVLAETDRIDRAGPTAGTATAPSGRVGTAGRREVAVTDGRTGGMRVVSVTAAPLPPPVPAAVGGTATTSADPRRTLRSAPTTAVPMRGRPLRTRAPIGGRQASDTRPVTIGAARPVVCGGATATEPTAVPPGQNGAVTATERTAVPPGRNGEVTAPRAGGPRVGGVRTGRAGAAVPVPAARRRACP